MEGKRMERCEKDVKAEQGIRTKNRSSKILLKQGKK
jgi:hypothetical protein